MLRCSRPKIHLLLTLPLALGLTACPPNDDLDIRGTMEIDKSTEIDNLTVRKDGKLKLRPGVQITARGNIDISGTIEGQGDVTLISNNQGGTIQVSGNITTAPGTNAQDSTTTESTQAGSGQASGKIQILSELAQCDISGKLQTGPGGTGGNATVTGRTQTLAAQAGVGGGSGDILLSCANKLTISGSLRTGDGGSGGGAMVTNSAAGGEGLANSLGGGASGGITLRVATVGGTVTIAPGAMIRGGDAGSNGTAIAEGDLATASSTAEKVNAGSIDISADNGNIAPRAIQTGSGGKNGTPGEIQASASARQLSAQATVSNGGDAGMLLNLAQRNGNPGKGGSTGDARAMVAGTAAVTDKGSEPQGTNGAQGARARQVP